MRGTNFINYSLMNGNENAFGDSLIQDKQRLPRGILKRPSPALKKTSQQSNDTVVIHIDAGTPTSVIASSFESHLPSHPINARCKFCNYYGKTRTTDESSGFLLCLIFVCLVMGVLVVPLFFLVCLIPLWRQSRVIKHFCQICDYQIGFGCRVQGSEK